MDHSVEIEIVLPESTYQALRQAAEEKHKTESELAADAIRAYFEPEGLQVSLLGLFADEPNLIDQITEKAMQTRETAALRLAR